MPHPSKEQRERRRLEAIAHHEAGHAVIAFILRRAIRHVSVIPDGDSLGHVLKTAPPKSTRPGAGTYSRIRDWLDRETMINLAGGLAEARFTGRRNHMGASGDYRQCIDLGSHVYGSGEVLTAYMEFMTALTRAHVEHPRQWIRIEALAAALLEHGRIGAGRAREICKAASLNRERYAELSEDFLERQEARRLRSPEGLSEAV